MKASWRRLQAGCSRYHGIYSLHSFLHRYYLPDALRLSLLGDRLQGELTCRRTTLFAHGKTPNIGPV
jgi:hypothetical protein